MNRQQVLELNFSRAKIKQRSITSLFPKFQDRVRDVKAKGGARFVGADKNNWYFKVTSGTTDGKKYDIVVEFLDVPKTIENIIRTSKDIWTTDKEWIDYRKLADIFIDKVDIKWKCNCPADSFYGAQYIRTQRGAEQDGQEDRPPKIKNPKEYGFGCKHLENLFDVFPFYVSTLAKWLKENYLDIVSAEENSMKRMRKGFKKAAAELGKLAPKEEELKKEEVKAPAAKETPETPEKEIKK